MALQFEIKININTKNNSNTKYHEKNYNLIDLIIII